MEEKNFYDVIIIGGGASGLFCAATYGKKIRGLIIEKTNYLGKKLLMSGGGQCNITHSGDIKEFIKHYGESGKKIRSVLYQFNNKSVVDFFEEKGLSMLEREDGKIFLKSLDARDILEVLRKSGTQNGFEVIYNNSVSKINIKNGKYEIECNDLEKKNRFITNKVIIASGGCSYPSTGSDGSMFQVLEEMGLEIIKPKPALTSIFVQDYPYGQLSGISISPAIIKVNGKENCDDLLFTHQNFSGPAVINISRYIRTGDKVIINYFPGKNSEEIITDIKQKIPKNSKQVINFLLEYLGTTMPKRFIEKICDRANIVTNQKVSSLTGSQIRTLVELLTKDNFSISGTGGFNTAMVTAGGVALTEINLKTMECRKYPGIFLIGEVLDVDGDTGGYNLQFACSSGYLAGNTKY